jgi:hypothetical protein
MMSGRLSEVEEAGEVAHNDNLAEAKTSHNDNLAEAKTSWFTWRKREAPEDPKQHLILNPDRIH